MKTLLALALLLAAGINAKAADKIEKYALRTKANAEVNSFCDKFTEMDLNLSKKTATLTNKVRGACDMYVAPNTRVYNLERQALPTNMPVGNATEIYTGQDRSANFSIQLTYAMNPNYIYPKTAIVEEGSVKLYGKSFFPAAQRGPIIRPIPKPKPNDQDQPPQTLSDKEQADYLKQVLASKELVNAVQDTRARVSCENPGVNVSRVYSRGVSPQPRLVINYICVDQNEKTSLIVTLSLDSKKVTEQSQIVQKEL